MQFKQVLILIGTLVVVLLSVSTPTSASLMGVQQQTSTLTPADYEIIPIDDGTQIIPHTPLINVYFWKANLMFFISSIFSVTPYHDFILQEIIPILSILLGSLPFIIVFSRKKSLSETATKILAFLKENPVSSEPTIIRGVGKSRGAVSYQLHCLLFDEQIHAAEIQGKTYYSLSPIFKDSPETALHLLKNNKTRSAIFAYICEHPGTTRKELTEALSFTPDTVRYHLKNLDAHLIKKEQVGDEEMYTAEEWAKEFFKNS